MPNVIDNIALRLVDTLREMLAVSYRADFCVGYFHLRGWRKIDDLVELFEGMPGKDARVLVGMFRPPQIESQEALSINGQPENTAAIMKRRETELVNSFKQQLTFGMPDNASEAGLRRLVRQLRAGKVHVKLFLPYHLHAKLYLTYNDHPSAPIKAFIGSSNLTGPGLSEQGELNVDETDSDTTVKLQGWFEQRWNDPYCRDISDVLASIIEASWVREAPLSPYLVYLKIAYHLAFEALEAPREYSLPRRFEEIVLPFQRDAILRLRRMLRTNAAYPQANRVALIGDVVGMGKTLTATAVAKIFDDEGNHGKCVVCCPAKLVSMWKGYLQLYDIAGEVVSYSQTKRLFDIKGLTGLLILDESHNLRNRETLAWTDIRDFVTLHNAKVLLLSATPYNKHYADLSNQFRLVLDEKADLSVRPESLFRTMSEEQFFSKFQASPRSLVAFEHSVSPDDWRDLLRLFMVRRTRGYIIKNYADVDEVSGRHYITIPATGQRSYFPKRVPKALKFDVIHGDQYSRLFNGEVVDTINRLCLPRYGLGSYVDVDIAALAPKTEQELLDNLSQAGKRLLGYCRTNLFKRLESSGYCFLLSLERHALRNLVYVHAIDAGLDLPIGTQDSNLLDTSLSDIDVDSSAQLLESDVLSDDEQQTEEFIDPVKTSLADLQARAAIVYAQYLQARKQGRKLFKWIPSRYFNAQLRADLLTDAMELLGIICQAGSWDAAHDEKLATLYRLLTAEERKSKVLVFTQFADTARYLAAQLSTTRYQVQGGVAAVTAETANPSDLVRRFSPQSNQYELRSGLESLRVLIATEVLSEGQNCQDANVVVNFDLPWAIIRLIQRAGRIDRIGQENDEVRIYSSIPAEGVDQLISLRSRLRSRLKENQEVIGTDERFFEDEQEAERLSDIYAEKQDAFDDDGVDADDVDLPSLAQSIWEQALKADPTLEQQVKALPDQVFATRDAAVGQGVLVYFKTAEGFDSLVRMDRAGHVVTQSLLGILRAAECPPDTEAFPRHAEHHYLVRMGVEEAMKPFLQEGGNLGPSTSARRRVYERLSLYRDELNTANQTTLFAPLDATKLDKIVNEIHKHALTERARERFNRRLREGTNNESLAELAGHLYDDGLLTAPIEQQQQRNPTLICSIGLFPKEETLLAE